MPQFSFDISSEINMSELDHAVDQARREITNRYDFKNTAAALDYTDEKKTSLTIEGDNDYHIEAITDMMRSKLAKRGISQKAIDTTKNVEPAGMIVRKQLPFQQGLDSTKAKVITKRLRDNFPKVKAQIQGETVRVTSGSKDDLQAVMEDIKKADLDFPVSFGNYR